MIAALASGLLLGLSCGLAPGPLLALVLAQSLRHGAREGCKIALTPLLTDTPIILLTLLLAAKLAELRRLLGMVSIAGGAFVLYLAWRDRRSEIAYWPTRAQWAFYLAILIAIVNLGVYFGSRVFGAHSLRINGLVGVGWLLVFPICGFTIWRVWHEQHTYR